jgi:outer membrane receptor protein involved in Fe transport
MPGWPQSNATSPSTLAGAVKDSSGAAIPGARVTVTAGDFSTSATTDSSGHFEIAPLPASSAVVEVQADGFAGWTGTWKAGAPFAVTLQPASPVQRITVTATRIPEKVSDTAASVTVLSSEDLQTAPVVAIDDALKQVPGFMLFRRSSSLTANPTSQGVSLRGVGASGASRALVLSEGIPINDPFGGWVYWGRVPQAAVEEVDIVQGGVSDLYGTNAVGGAINILTQHPESSTLTFVGSYGSEGTWLGSFAGTLRAQDWFFTLEGEAFRMDGYIPTVESQRGSVDRPANSRHGTANLTVDRTFGSQGRIFLRGATFQESRGNGTPAQTNQTHLRQLMGGGDWQSDQLGAFQIRMFGGPETYDQSFSSIALDRNSEALNRIQRVPVRQAGISVQWTRQAGVRQTLVAGFEASDVRGYSNEVAIANGAGTTASGTGGRQRTEGLYAEDIIRLTPRWMLTAGMRLDNWRNYDGLLVSHSLVTTAPPSITDYAGRTRQSFSPRLSALHRVTNNFSLRASAYGAFRAPTLNELYRSFRQGNALTLANAGLTAERLAGAEAGASYTAFHDRLSARGTFFWMDLSDPVANVTLSSTPSLITRQRQNLGKTRSRGVELDLDGRVTRSLILSGGYQFADATVTSFPANTALVGLRIPHVPRNAFTVQARYSRPRWFSAALEGRFGGLEYDDDQNTLPLRRYFTLDALLSRSFGHGVEAFAGAQNLLDQQPDIARTPVLMVGPPFVARVGVRIVLY